MIRFNHMELTVPKGTLSKSREDIREFYGEMLGFEGLDIPILGQTGLPLRTDPETSQFLLVTEQRAYMASPGYDHLGFLMETREDVDRVLEKCKKRRTTDARVQIKEYADLVTGAVTTRAFYVRFLLPIWFDIQVQEYEDNAKPARSWSFK